MSNKPANISAIDAHRLVSMIYPVVISAESLSTSVGVNVPQDQFSVCRDKIDIVALVWFLRNKAGVAKSRIDTRLAYLEQLAIEEIETRGI